MRRPSSGFSRSNRSRIARRTGMSRSAQLILWNPPAARPRSFTSAEITVAKGNAPAQRVEARPNKGVPRTRRGGLPRPKGGEIEGL